MFRSLFTLIAAGLLLAGCTTNPVPEGYHGPLAHISDSTATSESNGLDFFVLESVDGRMIDDSISETIAANQGRGSVMDPVVIGRDVPARPARFGVRGLTHYAAPILSLTNTVYQITGEIRFTPAPGGHYVVKGKLGADYVGVWIEDADTGQVMGNKVEGPAPDTGR